MRRFLNNDVLDCAKFFLLRKRIVLVRTCFCSNFLAYHAGHSRWNNTLLPPASFQVHPRWNPAYLSAAFWGTHTAFCHWPYAVPSQTPTVSDEQLRWIFNTLAGQWFCAWPPMPLCSRLCRQHLSERLSVRLYTHKAFSRHTMKLKKVAESWWLKPIRTKQRQLSQINKSWEVDTAEDRSYNYSTVISWMMGLPYWKNDRLTSAETLTPQR